MKNAVTTFSKRVKRRLKVIQGEVGYIDKLLYAKGFRSKKDMLFPSFLIIGAAKAGTTWMYKNLSAHPKVFMPTLRNTSDPTEVRFFDQKIHYSLNWYSSLFNVEEVLEKNNIVCGEKSPKYYALEEKRVELIKQLMPNVRIILLLRNPIHRAWSHALMNLVKFSQRQLHEVSNEEFIHHFKVTEHLGYYSQHIRKWKKFFNEDSFFIGFYDDISMRPRELLTCIFDFINVNAGDLDWEKMPMRQRINKGPTFALPPGELLDYLRKMYIDEISVLARMLKSDQVVEWLNFDQ